jgi:hypothetical protein
MFKLNPSISIITSTADDLSNIITRDRLFVKVGEKARPYYMLHIISQLKISRHEEDKVKQY